MNDLYTLLDRGKQCTDRLITIRLSIDSSGSDDSSLGRHKGGITPSGRSSHRASHTRSIQNHPLTPIELRVGVRPRDRASPSNTECAIEPREGDRDTAIFAAVLYTLTCPIQQIHKRSALHIAFSFRFLILYAHQLVKDFYRSFTPSLCFHWRYPRLTLRGPPG